MAPSKKRTSSALTKDDEEARRTSSDKAHPPKRLKEPSPPPSSHDPSPSPDSPSAYNNTFPSTQPPTQRYSTRKKSVNLGQFGLKKHTQSEISAGTQRKRAEKDAADTEKAAASKAKMQRQKVGIG
ncbi:hypothetical protein HYDPIDRAFT_33727 [Hydnomerulius pinastri MD-312]|uniref:Uncharacterized protein n=1 Tax=Hydnomerulius pinastri MD-312 TaxID=994086 RepID=A0A0C9VZG5_9AGAM|nr:hypothetical protein HYDPIDRAFT_33727 [Hydnomerulius pinastri MD-312]